MEESKEFRIDGPTKAALVLFGFSGQLAWAVENQFFNTFLYDKITPDPRPISWMVAATALVAVLTTIFIGALSDRTRGKWGRRKPYMLFGYILWGIFTASFPFAALFKPVSLGVAMAIIFDCIMSFFGSTANDAAFNAYVTDITTVKNRGKVLGILEILKWLALLIVYGGAGFIVASLGYFFFFYIIGGLTLVMGVIAGFFVKEPELPPKPMIGYWEQITGSFKLDSIRQNKDLFLVLVSVTIWNLAFNVFFSYLLIYIQRYLKMGTAESSLLIAICILVGGILMGYPLGVIADKWGKKRLSILAIFIEFAGLMAFSFARSFWPLLVAGIFWILPMAAWNIATGAWTKELFPDEARAQFQGYEVLFRVTFTMIPGPLIGGWLASSYGISTVIEGKPGFIPTPLIFQVAAIGTLFALVPLIKAREKKATKA